jgi:hypothetical protein
MFVKVLAHSSCVLFGLFSIAATAGNIQPVYSLKNLGELKASDGVTFKKTQVKCNTRSALSYITSQSNSKQWCVEGSSLSCFETRIDAATEACLSDKVLVKAPVESTVNPTDEELQASAERQNLQDELLLTQQKKIEIQARQLELRKIELELVKLQGS